MELKLTPEDLGKILIKWANENTPNFGFNDVEIQTEGYSSQRFTGVVLSSIESEKGHE